MKTRTQRLVKLACIACFIACVGDLAVLYILGSYYPGYSQVKNTMSSLGASASPVSNLMSAWWIFVGLLFIFFGIGFKRVFAEKGKNAAIVSWLIILYGLGEGIGSGVFKADYINNSLTIAAMMHDALGAVGVVAILILPLFMKKLLTNAESPGFHTLSIAVFILGIIMLLLFSFRISGDKTNFLYLYKGLWQRLMMLNIYIYFMTIAFIMYRKVAGFPSDFNKN
jgi:hypothetical protein